MSSFFLFCTLFLTRRAQLARGGPSSSATAKNKQHPGGYHPAKECYRENRVPHGKTPVSSVVDRIPILSVNTERIGILSYGSFYPVRGFCELRHARSGAGLIPHSRSPMMEMDMAPEQC